MLFRSTGEAGDATLARNKEQMLASRANLSYEFLPGQRIGAHYLFNRFTRDIDDPMLSQAERELTDTRRMSKNVAGVSIESKSIEDRLKLSAFYKYYHQRASLTDPEKVDGVYIGRKYSLSANASGYGGAVSFALFRQLTLQLSGEKALRLPDEKELLGNTTENIDPSYSLKPEESTNLNLGVLVGPFRSNGHRIGLDVNLYYRDIRNMISRSVSNSLTAETYAYENLGKVKSKGVDAEVNYGFRDIDRKSVG